MSDQPKPTGDAHRLFEPEDEPNIISRSTPAHKPTSGYTCTCNRENRGALQHSSHCLVANLTANSSPQPKPTGEWTASVWRALDAAIAAARQEGWTEGREHERKCAAAAQQPLVKLLEAIVRERPVQDKAASAFYRVRQKAKYALSKMNTMSIEHKPTTGEWTIEMVTDWGCDSRSVARIIADTHNAALQPLVKPTGEHSEACQSGFPDYDCPICGDELPKPYALGECAKVMDKRPFSRSLSPKPTGEWTALAAERERHIELVRENELLTNQLAADREKVQTYEGALIKIANDPNCDRCQMAVDALAKVGQ